MANLNQIKGQIKSVKNLKKITRALEVVSTVKLQKTKDKAEALKNYILDLLYILNNTGNKLDIFSSSDTKSDRELVVLISTDRGLCGALNSKLFKTVLDEYGDKKDKVDFFVVGKKGLEFLARYGFNVVGNTSLKDNFTDSDLNVLHSFLDKELSASNYGAVKLYFNYFKNSLVQIPTGINLFPLNQESFDSFISDLSIDYSSKADFRGRDLILEPNVELLVEEIKRQIRNYLIMSAIVQNKTGEYASRMIAMKNAKDNSSSKIDSLTLTFNKARQGAITQEISEIVGAKAALE